MRLDPDRAHAGAAAAVRNAERLVQVQMRDVGADLRDPADADQRVEIGAVQIDLPAVLVDDRADVPDRRLEHAVRRGVGDHQRREVGVRGRLGAQVVEVDVAAVVAADHHHLEAGHVRARRVGAVRRGGDQADLPVRLAAHFVILQDGQQARILALAAGVRLQADRRKSGDLGEPRRQLAEQLPVALGLVERRERMQRAELGQVTGIISVVAFSFMVHEPSGIMVRSSARSLSCRRRR